MKGKPKQAEGENDGGLGAVGRRTFLKLAATSTTISVPTIAGIYVASQPVVAEINEKEVRTDFDKTEGEMHEQVVAGQVNSFALNGNTDFRVQWQDMVRGDIIDLEMLVKLDQIDGVDAVTASGEKMEFARIGRMGVQVPTTSGSTHVTGDDFFENRRSVDITDHPDIELEDFNVDLENTNDYQKEVDFTVKLVGKAPNDSHNFEKIWEYSLTIEALLGLGIALGQALGVGNGS